jgi:EAL domain-containing protein (putative c-di-GMP-specific phosphodiesterase class I)
MESDALERKQFETRLRAALAKGEIRVVYQPILRLRDMTVNGLEALVRWRSPEIGDVPAEQLIAVAEESGLIREVGAFVLNRVCEDMRRWPETKVSVNISPSQLRDTTFVDGFRAILVRHGTDPARIELELTETVLLDDPDAAAARLTELRKLGVSMALDDFGVGFASIGALRRFPIDRLKIDRTFVAGIEPSKDDGGLVKSFVVLANSMGVAVVCEGIETAAQARILTALGCEFGQGYLFSRPLEPDDMEARLKSGTGFPAREVKESPAFDIRADAG